jgi:hypothetical protein
MQSAEVVLTALRERSASRAGYTHTRLYRHLFNPGLYSVGHANGAVLAELIASLRSESYRAKREREHDLLLGGALARLLGAVLGPMVTATRDQALAQLRGAGGCTWALSGRVGSWPEAKADGVLAALGVLDGRLRELVRRHVVALGVESEAGGVVRQAAPAALDRCMRSLVPGLTYARAGDEFIVLGTGAPWMELPGQIRASLRDALGVECIRLQFTDLTRGRGVFSGYELVAKPFGCRLLVSAGAVRDRLKRFTSRGKPVAVGGRAAWPVRRIIACYRRELLDLWSEYRLAEDAWPKVKWFRYYHFRSLVKTLALKESASPRAILRKYGVATPTGSRTVGWGPDTYPADRPWAP